MRSAKALPEPSSAKRDQAGHTQAPRVIDVDKNAAYPVATAALKEDGTLDDRTEASLVKYLNNVIEQKARKGANCFGHLSLKNLCNTTLASRGGTDSPIWAAMSCNESYCIQS